MTRFHSHRRRTKGAWTPRAFTLFEIEGYSGEEVAKVQGVPINTVWARIHKARKKLQERASRVDKQGTRRIG